jgi:hypothetical protein
MKLSFIGQIFSFACLFGCGNDISTKPFRTFKTLKEESRTKYALVRAKIEDFLEHIPSCPEKDADRSGPCEFLNVDFSPRPPSAKSKGQRILVLDEGMRLAAYTRYRSRVLDDIEADNEGIYRSTSKTLTITRGLFHILHDILNTAHPDTPALALEGISHSNGDRGSVLFSPSYVIAHGERIFGTLADLNPDAEFVIAQMSDFPVHALKSQQSEQEVLEIISSHLENIVQSLITHIEKFEINFVNMSFGHTTQTIRDTLSPFISPTMRTNDFFRRILKITKEKYYDRLFSLKHVIFVQAGASSSSEILSGDSDFTVDCASYNNRIRVGFIELLQTDVPPEGALREDYIRSTGAKNCIDVFVNSGVVYQDLDTRILGDHPYMSTRSGMEVVHPYDHFATSWATPFALSYLNHLKQAAAMSETPFSFSRLIESKYILEPVKYEQFEIFRTGRL